jgi:hypothetical protein
MWPGSVTVFSMIWEVAIPASPHDEAGFNAQSILSKPDTVE